MGLVSRASPVQTAVGNCTRDEGGPFEVGNHGPISSRCKLLRSKAVVVSVAVKLGPKVQDGKVERDERKRTVDEVSKSDCGRCQNRGLTRPPGKARGWHVHIGGANLD